MIPGPIGSIDRAVLKGLIESVVPEGTTLEYKETWSGRSERDVGKHRAGVSSLANTAGGDYVLGVRAPKGVPLALVGMQVPDLDAEKLRLEHLLLNNPEPRVPCPGCATAQHDRQDAEAPYGVRRPTALAGEDPVQQMPLEPDRNLAAAFRAPVPHDAEAGRARALPASAS